MIDNRGTTSDERQGLSCFRSPETPSLLSLPTKTLPLVLDEVSRDSERRVVRPRVDRIQRRLTLEGTTSGLTRFGPESPQVSQTGSGRRVGPGRYRRTNRRPSAPTRCGQPVPGGRREPSSSWTHPCPDSVREWVGESAKTFGEGPLPRETE